MPTIAGLTAATSCTDADLLWINQGTGSDRDKKASLGQVVAGGLPAATLALGALTVSGTDSIPMAKAGPTGGRTTPNGIVSAGMIGNDWLVQAVDLGKLSSNIPKFLGIASGSDVGIVAATSARQLIVSRRPLSKDASTREFRIVLRADLLGQAGSASNSGGAVLEIASAALPSGWYTQIETLATAYPGALSAAILVSNAVSPTSYQGIGSLYVGSSVIRIPLGTTWQTLMPLSATAGARISVEVALCPSDLVTGI